MPGRGHSADGQSPDPRGAGKVRPDRVTPDRPSGSTPLQRATFGRGCCSSLSSGTGGGFSYPGPSACSWASRRGSGRSQAAAVLIFHRAPPVLGPVDLAQQVARRSPKPEGAGSSPAVGAAPHTDAGARGKPRGGPVERLLRARPSTCGVVGMRCREPNASAPSLDART